ncbi:MAG: insulinase family protein, partial [Candidatus Cloacimonetes bacterium]|nr:insulinase family protein [Candidatus Cloacimonadota bacterium]
FTQGEFQRALSSLQTNLERRVLEKDKEGSNRLTWSYLGKVLFDQPLIGEEQQLMLFNLAKELIKVEDVDRAFSALITDENFVFTLRGPNKPEIHYPAEEEVFALRKGIQSQVINPYVDETLEQPLLTGIPNPRKIRKTQVLKKSGITKWVLANGATVYALKTTNKNDEILFSAYSPGGLSLYPPEDVVTARHATGIVFESGFGDFNRINLNKALAGKTLYLNADIGVFEENLRGSFAPRDAESFFQYLFQILTNPRNCSDSFASYLQKQITFEENSQLDPETVFWETVEVITNGNNPYLRPETATEIKQIDHKRALEIYMDRFGDFSDFTFFFVGNFEEQTLKRFSEVYLANLPSLKRKEKPGNIRLQYPQGQLTRTINLGKDEKSMVLGINIHKSKFKLQDQIAMGALEQLMSEKLRINIREARSGAYAVQFQADLKKVPDSKSLFYTMLYCAPDRHEELFSAIYATLDSVKAGNITSSELASVKTTLQKNLESQMISNRFFLEQMRSNFADGFPVDSYLKIKQQYEKLDRKRLIKLLKKYMTHEEDLIRIIRLPRTDA